MVDHRLISEHDGWDEYTTLKVDIDERNIATITLNRPDKHNAFNDEMIDHLQRALDDMSRHYRPRVLILRGEGKSFSAGADLEWMRRMAEYSRIDNMRDSKNMAFMMRTLNYFPHPTIAVVQGAAFGGGVGLAACCDMAVVSTKAVFSLSEVKLGLLPSAISPYVIAKVGEAYARRYFLTGERFPADEAVRMGLGTILAEPEGMDVAVNYLVERLLEGGPQAQSDAKDLIYYVQDRHMNEDLMMETVVRIADARASDEGKEGVAAFFDKRKPSWVTGEDAPAETEKAEEKKEEAAPEAEEKPEEKAVEAAPAEVAVKQEAAEPEAPAKEAEAPAPEAAQPSQEQPAQEQPVAPQPEAAVPTTEQAADQQPAPAAEQPAPEQSAPEQPAAAQPAPEAAPAPQPEVQQPAPAAQPPEQAAPAPQSEAQQPAPAASQPQAPQPEAQPPAQPAAQPAPAQPAPEAAPASQPDAQQPAAQPAAQPQPESASPAPQSNPQPTPQPTHPPQE